VCVQCTVQIETVFVLCTVHSAVLDCYRCLYSAQCRVRPLMVCLQFTVRSETVIGVFLQGTVQTETLILCM